MELLGQYLDAKGVFVDPEKVELLRNTPTLKTKTEFRIFLGLSGYYRRFFKVFSKLSAALHAAKTGKGLVDWNEKI